MYQDSSSRLYKKDCCRRVKGFINFILSSLKNISGGEIRYPCVKYKNKKSYQSNVMTIHLIKKSLLRNICDHLHTALCSLGDHFRKD